MENRRSQEETDCYTLQYKALICRKFAKEKRKEKATAGRASGCIFAENLQKFMTLFHFNLYFMKKDHFTLFVFIAFSMKLFCQSSSCMISGILTYLDSTCVVSSLDLLEPYPQPGSPAFLLDEYVYLESKKERNTERGQEAILDARIGGDTILCRFTEALGMEISREHTPELYTLLIGMKETAGTLATMHAKRFYHRVRPFIYYHEQTLTPEAEPVLSTNGSYPSGHACMFWAIALILEEICPERQVEILQRGYEGGRSRLIVGAHWHSDVSAGRLLASTIVARLHADTAFIAQLELAKKEFEVKKRIADNVTPLTPQDKGRWKKVD